MNEDEGERLAWEARQKMTVREASGFAPRPDAPESAPLEAGQRHETPSLRVGEGVLLDAEEKMRVEKASELPPEPWRAVYFDHTRELALYDVDGNNILRLDSPEVHALLIAAPRTARRLAWLEAAAREAIFFLSADRGAASEAGEAVSEMVVEQVEKALRAALEETDAD
jgi:hypothetical protein